jgi:hypothetical protein
MTIRRSLDFFSPVHCVALTAWGVAIQKEIGCKSGYYKSREIIANRLHLCSPNFEIPSKLLSAVRGIKTSQGR